MGLKDMLRPHGNATDNTAARGEFEPASRSPFADLAPEPVLGTLVRTPEEGAGGNRKSVAPTSTTDADDDTAKRGVARLYGTPTNPVPPDAVPGTVTTADGVTLRTATFPARARPRLGTVVVLQGRNETIEKYFETARDLAALGHAVVAFDWRGQGGSDRLIAKPMKGHVRSFRHYERDLAAVMAQVVLPDMRPPYTLVGHSMGALLALLAGPSLPPEARRVVALAPLLRLVEQPLGNRGLKWAMGFLRLLGLGRLYAAGGPRPAEIPEFLTNVLTTDPARHERNGAMFLAHPHLALGGPTIAWVHSALVAMERMSRPRTLRAMSVPSLLIAAGDDQVVSTPAQERLVRRLRNSNVLTVDGARHELLQERDRYREQVIAAIHAFAARPDRMEDAVGAAVLEGSVTPVGEEAPEAETPAETEAPKVPEPAST